MIAFSRISARRAAAPSTPSKSPRGIGRRLTALSPPQNRASGLSPHAAPRSLTPLRSTGTVELALSPAPFTAIRPYPTCAGVPWVHRLRMSDPLSHVSPLARRVSPLHAALSAGLWIPHAFRLAAFASWDIVSSSALVPPSRGAYWQGGPFPLTLPEPRGVSTFPTCEMRSGWVSSLLRGHGTRTRRKWGVVPQPSSAVLVTHHSGAFP